MGAWQTKAIGEVFRVVNGGTPKTGVSEYWDGPHHWITPAEMGRLTSPYLSESRRTLTAEGLRVGAELVPADSIILSTRAPIGHLVINEVPMAFNQGCRGLVPSRGIDTKFAYYFLLANVPLLESLGTGATFKELSGGKLKEVPFRFPALPEQRRIVAILDEVFKAIATAKANTEKNLKNARELHAAARSAAFSQAMTSAPRVRLANVVDRLTNGYVGPIRGVYVDAGVPYLLARHVRDNRLQFDGKTFVSDAFNLKHKKSILKAGDLLLVQSGHIGHCAVVGPEHVGHNCHAMIVITPKPGLLLGAYLAEFFYTAEMLTHFERIRSGSTVPHLTCGEVRETSIPVPAIQIQQHVIERMADVADARSNLGETLNLKASALDELKKSLLRQAFTGQLTAKSTDKQLEAVA